jgi:hypothetical protein
VGGYGLIQCGAAALSGSRAFIFQSERSLWKETRHDHNITPDHRTEFEALTSGDCANFALFSCFVNGEPASAIVAVNRDGGGYAITPLFVSVTP